MDRQQHEIFRQRLLTAFELCEAGIEMYRLSLRRRHTGATDAEIHTLLRQWLERPSGAVDGDAEGEPIDISRFE